MTAPTEHRPRAPKPALTPEAPFPRRFTAWSATRFPVAVVVLMFFTFLTALLSGSSVTGHGPLGLRPLDLLGFVAFTSFALGLRIYDEHKDFASDQVLFPDRLTVTGVMPLADLRRVLAACLALQLVTSVLFDRGVGPVTVAWLAATAWSLLMLKEFFARTWLRAHPVLYAVSHNLVMPLLVLWAAFMGAGGAVAGPVLWWLCALSVTSTFLLELSRKMHAPEDERDGVDSYSKELGTGPAAWLGSAMLLASTVSVGGLVYAARGVAPVPWAVAAALLVLCAIPFARFAAKPEARRAGVLAASAAIHTLGCLLLVIVVLASARGLTWR